MFVQTQKTPNPNSLKFLPGKKVCNSEPFEIDDKSKTDNELVRNILSINGIKGIFVAKDFISVNKNENVKWEDIKHIIISFINEYYSSGNDIVIDKNKTVNQEKDLLDIEKKIINLLETKIRPAVAQDGGDIKFENYKNGVVQVKLEGSCSGCPSSKMTLKQGVQNLLCHYIPEIKEVVAN